MRRTTIITTFAVVALTTFIVKGITTLRTSTAHEAANGSAEISNPIYDLHVGYPDIQKLPVQDIPEP